MFTSFLLLIGLLLSDEFIALLIPTFEQLLDLSRNLNCDLQGLLMSR